jgi:muconolactone delta-isomerase
MEKEHPMQYLVQLRLSASSRPTSPEQGVALIEKAILPTLERCTELQAEGSILAGGPVSGSVALALIVSAESALALDNLITTLPAWPRMETQVVPLATFDERKQTVLSQLEELKARTDEAQMPRPSGGR